MTAPEIGQGTDPRRLGPGPTHWHTQIFGSVVGLGNSKPQLRQNEEGTGECGGGEGGARQGSPHTQAQVFLAKAPRTNPENSVKGGSVSLPQSCDLEEQV